MSWYSIRSAGETRATIDIDGEIGAWGVSSRQFKRDLKDLGDVKNIRVNINSVGGDVSDGVAIRAALQDHPATVTMHITGYALSIASYMTTGADKVTATADSLFMIHKPWTFAAGDANDMRKSADILDKHEDALILGYMERELDMDESELRDAIAEETWYSASEAKQAGFIDSIKGEDAKNSLAYASAFKFKNAPESFKAAFAASKPTETIKGSPAAKQTEGEIVTDEKMYSEAELQAKIDEAVEAAIAETDNEETVLMSLLEHPKASIEAIRMIADMELDAEQASKFLDYLPQTKTEEQKPVEAPEPKKDSVAAMLAKLASQVDSNVVNLKGLTEESDKTEEKSESVQDMFARLQGGM